MHIAGRPGWTPKSRVLQPIPTLCIRHSNTRSTQQHFPHVQSTSRFGSTSAELPLVGGRIHGMAEHGTTTMYRNGCKCAECRAANAAAARKMRARNSTARHRRARPKVVALPTNTEMPDAVIGMGPVERAVHDECDSLTRAADRPGILAMAYALGRRCDDPAHAAALATNTKQLQSLLAELQQSKKKIAPKRLAVVQAMTARR
jgi:hypothetical protein